MNPSRPPRPLVLTAAALAAALAAGLLAGCGGNGLATSDPGRGSAVTSPSAGASPSASARPTPTPSVRATPTPVPTAASDPAAPSAASATARPVPSTSGGQAGATASPAPLAATCPASGLAVGVREPAGGGAAGSRYVLLTFRNTSSGSCELDGHPGVSFVGHADGTQIGQPAARTGGVRTVRLGPGDTTTALLRISNAGNYPAGRCAPTTADGFRVYPPDSRASRFVAFRVQACQGDLGSDRQLTVSAVGRAG